jgi:hypothetical protein
MKLPRKIPYDVIKHLKVSIFKKNVIVAMETKQMQRRKTQIL